MIPSRRRVSSSASRPVSSTARIASRPGPVGAEQQARPLAWTVITLTLCAITSWSSFAIRVALLGDCGLGLFGLHAVELLRARLEQGVPLGDAPHDLAAGERPQRENDADEDVGRDERAVAGTNQDEQRDERDESADDRAAPILVEPDRCRGGEERSRRARSSRWRPCR